jgi:3-hydroxyanthranilate 3,4-dioxygenase
VVERQRGKEEIDRFIWPCEKCGNNLYETEVRFDDPGDAVSRATNSLKSNPALVTCKQCGEVLDL